MGDSHSDDGVWHSGELAVLEQVLGCVQVEFDIAAARQLDSAQGSVDTSLGRLQEALDAVAKDLEQDTGATLLQVRSVRCEAVDTVAATDLVCCWQQRHRGAELCGCGAGVREPQV